MLDSVKLDMLFGLMEEQKSAAVMIGPSNTLEYLTGFSPGGCERFQALVVTQDKNYFYICNKIYAEDMKPWFPFGTPFYVWHDGQVFYNTINTAFKDFRLYGKKIAVGESIRAVDLIDIRHQVSCDFFNGTSLLEELRIIKSEQDLDKMRQAADMADEVMADLTRFIKPGMTEKEIKIKINALFEKKGAQGLSFDPIVACGNNNSRPHYCGDSGVIAKKDVLLLDFGCRFSGYCSDISRTFFIGGISKEEEKIYAIVKEAQQAAVSSAKQGVPCRDVDKAAREYIEACGFGDFFLNRTGHGIGFDVHEAPYINANNARCLECGMAFSIEPGICIPGRVGMRIEDIVIINHQGRTEVLNTFTKDIVIVN